MCTGTPREIGSQLQRKNGPRCSVSQYVPNPVIHLFWGAHCDEKRLSVLPRTHLPLIHWSGWSWLPLFIFSKAAIVDVKHHKVTIPVSASLVLEVPQFWRDKYTDLFNRLSNIVLLLVHSFESFDHLFGSNMCRSNGKLKNLTNLSGQPTTTGHTICLSFRSLQCIFAFISKVVTLFKSCRSLKRLRQLLVSHANLVPFVCDHNEFFNLALCLLWSTLLHQRDATTPLPLHTAFSKAFYIKKWLSDFASRNSTVF